MNLRQFVLFQAALVVLLMVGCACCIHWRIGPHDTPVVDGAKLDAGE
jgi:hypothetical protein